MKRFLIHRLSGFLAVVGVSRLAPLNCSSRRESALISLAGRMSGLTSAATRFTASLPAIAAGLALLFEGSSMHAAETRAKSQPPADSSPGWQALFDGKTLKGWRETDFAGHGEVDVKDGQIMIGMGEMLSGVSWTNPVSRMDYELSLEAMKLDGSDFFCGLTFPVGTNCCTLILGGWGGALVGISSLDHQDASDNETTQFIKFDNKKWYRVRVRVTKTKLEVWLDNDQIVNVETEGRKIDMRPGDIELSQPLGVATYQTSSAIRNIRLRRLNASTPPASPPKQK